MFYAVLTEAAGNKSLFAVPAGYSIFFGKGNTMDTRIALIGIIVEQEEAAEQLNRILHEYRECIVGRMGIPYRKKGVNIISVAVDATEDKINALSGKIGRLNGVSAKTVYSNVISAHE